MWSRVYVGAHTNAFQVVEGNFFRLLLFDFQNACKPYGAVLQNVHVVEQVEGLEHHSHLLAVLGVAFFREDVFAVKDNFATGWCFQQIGASKQGGLSATG